ncbi:Lrp/AsnC family transcriptional regulator [Simiduia curdlanivorans]|uniref:Lrp/AsnC family transcriptional regulator n=1 Tax=Simiduia curdlanivorans TaxID=1492769 RepID=A0ABV8V6T9_9GAMM|nr:Lrp/AsnC family transcriptional regulator [Simiduia curdlanivorans]MDN3640241.1 Lrp/AsnC family transcriptional regulator [Simiduia curdlanivorans]
MKFDKLDLKILNELQLDARISNARLAERVSLSESACLSRVKKLQTQKWIAGYSAAINLTKLRHVHFLVNVSLISQDPKVNRDFKHAVAALPQIIRCYKISGEYDYILEFLCVDAAQFNSLSEGLLEQDLGIEKMHSQLVIEDAKPFGGLPLDELFELDDE